MLLIRQKSFFGRAPPGPAEGADIAPPDPPGWIMGEWRGKRRWKGRRDKEGEKRAERRGEWKEGEGKGGYSFRMKSWLLPC